MGVYSKTFTAATTVSVPGAEHQLATADLVFQCWDTSIPRNAIDAALTVDATTFDILLTFNVPQSGSLVVLSGVDALAPPLPPGSPAPPASLGGMHPMLQKMLVDLIGHSPYVGQDAYGKPIHGLAVSRPARIQYEVTTLVNAQGQERASTSRVFFNGDFTPLTVRDKLFLPDGTAPALQQVYTVHKPFTSALDHYEVLL